MIWLECKSRRRNTSRIFQITTCIFWNFGAYLLASREENGFQWIGK